MCIQVIQPGTEIGDSLIFYTALIVANELLSRPHGSSNIIVISPLKTLMEDQGGIFAVSGLNSNRPFAAGGHVTTSTLNQLAMTK